MADQNEPLTFNSRSKSPHDKFSNFYEAKLEMAEGVFGSVEHYFQAMKFIDGNHSRFEVNGDLGKRSFESGSWKEPVARARFVKSAGGKSGTAKYKLTLRSDGLDRERAKQKMKEGLQRKFETEPFRSLLLKTSDRVLVHTPMRGKTDYWTGRVDKNSGNITGENNMGKLLIEVRQELQKAENCSQNEDKKDAIANKSDDEETSRDSKDSLGYEGKKRKHEDDEVQDDREEPEGPEMKRKKIEIKSKDDDERKGVDENKGGDEETSRETKDSLGCEGKKRKHEDGEVQVKDDD